MKLLKRLLKKRNHALLDFVEETTTIINRKIMKNTITRLFLSFSLLVLLTSGTILGQSPSQTATRRIEKMLDTTSVPGMSVTVMKDGKIVYSKGFGKANLEHDVPVTTDTRFRLASVSKLVTAAAVARLVDTGKLDLDVPISQYVKDIPDAIGVVTSRQLTGHLAGIRHYQTKDFVPVSIDNKNFTTVQKSLDIFKNDPLLSTPGTKYRYTTFGFTLLAAVVSGASGQPFLEYIEKEVFNPIGIKSGGPDSPFLVVPNRTSFYMNGPQNKTLNAPYVNPSYKWAGGGMLMSSTDLARFGNGHLKAGFIKETTLQNMFVSQKTSDGNETGVGITWRIAKGYFGNAIYHHEGSMHGTRSALLVYPEQGIVVAFMTNLSGTPGFGYQTAQLLAQPFLEKKSGKTFDPTGKFEVAGKALGRDVKGTLEVRSSKSGYSGAFVFGQGRLEVIDAIAHDNGYYLVVAHRTGGLDVVPVNEDGNNGSRFNFTFKKV